MECRSCGASIEPNQAQCPSCGTPVQRGFQPPAPPAPPSTGNDPTQTWPAQYPPTQATPPASGYQPPTYEPPTAPTGGYWAPGGQQPGYQQPAYQQPPFQQPAYQTGPQPAATSTSPIALQATPLTIAGLLAAVAAIIGCFLTVAELKVDGDKLGSAKVGDLGSNSVLVGIITAVVLVIAVVIGAGSRRFATGLAGGAGLALAGWATLHLALGIQLIDILERQAIGSASGGEITLTKTFAAGFIVLIVAAVLGLVAFVLSLRSAKADDGAKFAPLAALIGGVGALAVAVGPLIPQNGAGFGDNFSNSAIPPATLWLRLLVLASLLVAALIGFFNGRRWGLGLATGAVVAAVVQALTTIGEAKGKPKVSIGIGNPGGDKIHIVTLIGVLLWIAGLAIAAVALNQQRQRTTR